jgi:hypothetical protein
MVIPLSLGIPCNWKIDPYAKIEDIIFLCKNNNFFDLHYTQKFWSHHLYIVYSINGYLKNFDLESPKNGVQGSFKSDSMNFVSPIQSCLWGIFPSLLWGSTTSTAHRAFHHQLLAIDQGRWTIGDQLFQGILSEEIYVAVPSYYDTVLLGEYMMRKYSIEILWMVARSCTCWWVVDPIIYRIQPSNVVQDFFLPP